MAEVSNKIIAKPAEPLIPEVVASCPQCGVTSGGDATFCYKCGANISQPAQALENPIIVPGTAQLYTPNDAHPFFGRMTQMFGLHPLVTFATFAVSVMLFGEEAASLMVGWLVAIPIALVLGVGVVFCQRYMFRDEWGAAIGKAIIVFVLTAIPTSIPTVLLVPSGALGVMKAIKSGKLTG